MFNPLVNVSKLTDEELQKKIYEVNKKILHSSRFQSNIIQQLQSLMLTYQTELERRKTNKMINEDPNFKPGVAYDSDGNIDKDKGEYDDLIDIN